jgi:hypothetical protein
VKERDGDIFDDTERKQCGELWIRRVNSENGLSHNRPKCRNDPTLTAPLLSSTLRYVSPDQNKKGTVNRGSPA